MIKKLTLFLALVSIFAVQAPTFAQKNPEIPSEITNMKSEGFTIVPADPNTISPRKFIFEVKPGSTSRDTVLIQNLSNEEANFSLYGADPTFSSQGTPAYKTRDAGGQAEGQWITFDESFIVLGAREEKIIPFTLNIPKDTAHSDYRVGIAMEKTKQDINNPNITIATRLILHSEIKVTDNPNMVTKQSGSQNAPEEKEPLKIYYFWISLTLFVISFVALVWITFEEKKSPIQTVATTAAAGSRTSKARRPKGSSSGRVIQRAPKGERKARKVKKSSSKSKSSAKQKVATKKISSVRKTTKKGSSKKSSGTSKGTSTKGRQKKK